MRIKIDHIQFLNGTIDAYIMKCMKYVKALWTSKLFSFNSNNCLIILFLYENNMTMAMRRIQKIKKLYFGFPQNWLACMRSLYICWNLKYAISRHLENFNFYYFKTLIVGLFISIITGTWTLLELSFLKNDKLSVGTCL